MRNVNLLAGLISILVPYEKSEFFPRRHYYTLRMKRKSEMKKMCALRSMIKYRTEIRQGLLL